MNPKTKVVFLQPLIPPDAGWDEIVEQARERGLEVSRLRNRRLRIPRGF